MDEPCPVPPEKPLASDCCDSGCERCVFAVYDEALAEFERDRLAWQARMQALNAPAAIAGER